MACKESPFKIKVSNSQLYREHPASSGARWEGEKGHSKGLPDKSIAVLSDGRGNVQLKIPSSDEINRAHPLGPCLALYSLQIDVDHSFKQLQEMQMLYMFPKLSTLDLRRVRCDQRDVDKLLGQVGKICMDSPASLLASIKAGRGRHGATQTSFEACTISMEDLNSVVTECLLLQSMTIMFQVYFQGTESEMSATWNSPLRRLDCRIACRNELRDMKPPSWYDAQEYAITQRVASSFMRRLGSKVRMQDLLNAPCTLLAGPLAVSCSCPWILCADFPNCLVYEI